ncbi:unnamed protein product, partial [marine sediment metagenome]
HYRVTDLFAINRMLGESVGKITKYEVKNA